MQKFFLSICTIILITLSACSKKDKGPLGDIEDKDDQYKEVCEHVNTNIESIRSLVGLLRGDDIIEYVTPIKDGDKEIGYTLGITPSQSISIYTNNKYTSPAIGIKPDVNGDFYWTLNGEWLLDSSGNKVLCNGTSYSILPKLKVENGNWMLSIDNGKTWKNIEKISSNTLGNKGIFKEINISNAENITITFADGYELVIPREPELTISFSEEKQILVKPNATITIDYTITGKTDGLKIEVVTSGNVKAEIVNKEATKGMITITTGESIDENDKVILIAKNESVSTSKSLSFNEEKYLIVTSDTSYEIENEGGTIEFNIETNTDYSISIPEQAKSWISIVESRAIRQETIRLNVDASNDGNRFAEVSLINNKGDYLAIIHISQKGVVPCFTIQGGSIINVEEEGGTIDLQIESNIEYSVSIPDESRSWISLVESRTIRQETVTFSIRENEGNARSAIILFIDKNMNKLDSVQIYQSAHPSDIPSDMTKAFPDKKFRDYVLENFDRNKDGVISGNEALLVEKIKCFMKGIISLEGIQYFRNLKILDCSYNNLKSLNLSQNIVLTELKCSYNNEMITLDVSGCKSLTKLNCEGSGLITLDVSGSIALTELNCSTNREMITLDVSDCRALTVLNCGYNRLSKLNVFGCTALTELNCYTNKLTTLDVSSCKALTWLSCGDNPLTSLDVSQNTVLTKLYCSDNKFTTLDISNCTLLTLLSCDDSPLTSLDVSQNTALTELYCSRCRLSFLDVSKNVALTKLRCFGNELTTLDMSNCTLLTELTCCLNKLSLLDISGCMALTKLDCDRNTLNSLDVSGCKALAELNCSQNQLISLDVSNCFVLTTLDCRYMLTLKTLYLKKGINIPDLRKGSETEIIYVD